jgi:hypothetical protein
MKKPGFASPQEAEEAFYDAFATGNMAAMEEVWENADDVECIHPMGARLVGHAVLESWKNMFEQAGPVAFHLTDRREHQDGGLAIHVVTENIHFQDDTTKPLRFLTTNVYRRHDDRWRMILRHSSPAPMDSSQEHEPASHSVH